VICFGGGALLVYGPSRVADAAGGQAWAYLYIVAVAAAMGYGNFFAARWADRGLGSEPGSTSPTTWQGVLGTFAMLALGAVLLWWATDVWGTGNRLLLGAVAALLLALSVWRGISTARSAVTARQARRN
jgi:hypothetical protein